MGRGSRGTHAAHTLEPYGALYGVLRVPVLMAPASISVLHFPRVVFPAPSGLNGQTKRSERRPAGRARHAPAPGAGPQWAPRVLWGPQPKSARHASLALCPHRVMFPMHEPPTLHQQRCRRHFSACCGWLLPLRIRSRKTSLPLPAQKTALLDSCAAPARTRLVFRMAIRAPVVASAV